jgi:hypothetical protein
MAVEEAFPDGSALPISGHTHIGFEASLHWSARLERVSDSRMTHVRLAGQLMFSQPCSGGVPSRDGGSSCESHLQALSYGLRGSRRGFYHLVIRPWLLVSRVRRQCDDGKS